MSKRSIASVLSDKFDSQVFPKIKHLYHRLNKPGERKVLFIAGVQRSGTNMVMDVLERSWETDVYHESDQRAFNNYQMRDKSVIEDLYRKSVSPLFVIKSLCELQDLTDLMAKFSPAKTVWVTRNYDDVVNSMLVSFNNQAKQICVLSADREMGGWWLGKGISDKTYEVVQRFADEELTDASAAALQWYLRGKLFFEQGFDRDSRVLVVKYEKLVTSPEKEFTRVFAFSELNYSKSVSGNVFSSSIEKRSAPEINLQIRELCNGLAARFDQLA